MTTLLHPSPVSKTSASEEAVCVDSLSAASISDEVSPFRKVALTLEEFLPLAMEEGFDRQLINGTMWERPMTVRNRRHTAATARFSQHLNNYLDQTDAVDAQAFDGEVGVILPGRETAVGIDVAVFSRETLDQQDDSDTRMFRGLPLLAVEVLSGSDTIDGVDAKVVEYLAAGVPLIWIANPLRRSVSAYTANSERTFHRNDRLTADILPGFEVVTRQLFGRE